MSPDDDLADYLAESWKPRGSIVADELRSERLHLRQWREEDRAPFAAMNADPVVMAHFPSPLSRGASNAMLSRIRSHMAEHGYGLWAVEGAEGFLGFTGLAWTDVTGERELEVGWRFAAAAWGHGYATEAATAALAYGLARVPRVISFTAVANVRSERVMQRIGLVRVREFDHPRAALPDRLKRHVLYASG